MHGNRVSELRGLHEAHRAGDGRLNCTQPKLMSTPESHKDTVTDPYTKKVVGAKLYRQSRARAKSMREGMSRALAEAKRRGVPLSTIVPVS